MSELKQSEKQVVLVTSGAIGAGLSRVPLDKKTMSAVEKQAVATVGQCLLIGVYSKLFRKYDLTPGQILITKDMVANEKRAKNTKLVFQAMLANGITPIVNENDAMLLEEVMFGNNDSLAAYVATVVSADLLIMLTDVEGLFDRNPTQAGAKVIREVTRISDEIRDAVGGPSHNFGTGGMITKITAAEDAARAGAKTVIVGGADPSVVHDVLDGKEVGTYFNLN
jgi:glutamate 5-kinase